METPGFALLANQPKLCPRCRSRAGCQRAWKPFKQAAPEHPLVFSPGWAALSMSSQALLWVPYLIGMAMLEACSIVVRAQLSEYLLVPILLGCLAALMSLYLLRDNCSSPGGYAASISRVSASIYSEGYVFMFIALITIAVYLLRRINFVQEMILRRTSRIRLLTCGSPTKAAADALAKAFEDTDQGRAPGDAYTRRFRCDRALRYGIVLTGITGVIPDRADDCDLDPSVGSCSNRIMRKLHLAGIGAGVAITLVAALARMACTFSLYTTDKGKKRARFAVGLAVLATLATLGFLVAFMIVLDPQKDEAAEMHLCTLYTSRAACVGEHVPRRWYNLTVDELGAWPCRWDDAAIVTEKPCTNPDCKDGDHLAIMQASIICEFHLLLYWIVTLMCALMLMEDAEVWTPLAGGEGDDDAGRPPVTPKVAPDSPHPA